MNLKTFPPLAAAALLCCAAPLSAFHPMITEDTYFLDRGVFRGEAAFDHTRATRGPDAFTNTLSGEFTYGLWDKLEVMISAPWQGWNSGGLSASGLGDVALEAKFWAASRGGWDLALRPGFSLPAGNDAKSLGAGKGHIWLKGLLGREEGPRQYFLSVGYELNRNTSGERMHLFSASAMAGLEVFPRVILAAELAAETSAERDSSSPPLHSVLGLVWSPVPALDLSAGARLGLNDAAGDLGLLLGVTLRL